MIKEQDILLAEKIIKTSNPKDVAIELAIRIRNEQEQETLNKPEYDMGFYVFMFGIVLGFVFGLFFKI